MKRTFLLLTVPVLFSLLFLPKAAAGEEPPTLLSKGTYFTVYGSRVSDIATILSKINFNYSVTFDDLLSERSEDPASQLARTVDALYLEVSDILDIHMYSYHGTIKILSDRHQISSMFRTYFRQTFSERSFYLHEKNTIYISGKDLRLGMLGHEIAHAIISHYFVVPPPVKIQEVLAGYVEYQLRKSAGTLPRKR